MKHAIQMNEADFSKRPPKFSLDKLSLDKCPCSKSFRPVFGWEDFPKEYFSYHKFKLVARETSST